MTILMIKRPRYLFLFFLTWLFSLKLLAQCDLVAAKKYTPPLNRQLFHDEVNIEQKNILKADGKDDGKLTVSPNEEINFLLTKAVTDKIDCMQYRIEIDSSLTAQKKILYVRKIASFLGNWLKGWKSGQADPINLPTIIQEYDDCIQLEKKGISIADYFEKVS